MEFSNLTVLTLSITATFQFAGTNKKNGPWFINCLPVLTIKKNFSNSMVKFEIFIINIQKSKQLQEIFMHSQKWKRQE